jgi:5-methylcytosine-specific restriction endonuclease McrA
VSKYKDQLEAYYGQQKACSECGKTWLLKDWPKVQSSGKPKRTCCLTAGWNNKKKYEDRKKNIGDAIFYLCRSCKKHKSEDSFHKQGQSGFKSTCKECHRSKYARYVSKSSKQSKEEARKRKIKRDNEIIKCKVCGNELKRKDFPRQASGRIANICCNHRSTGHVNRYLAKRGKRLCGSCEIIKPLDHFCFIDDKPVNPCKVCRKVNCSRQASTQKRLDRIVESDDGTLSSSVIRSLFIKAKKCLVCFEDMEYADKTMDHILPLSKGGEHSIKNVMIICHRCNSKKKDKDPSVWLSSLSNDSKASVLNYIQKSEHLKKDLFK